MSRPIKFRGMGIKGDWHHGNLAILTQKLNHVEPGHYISNKVGVPFAYQVRPETVGEFTGLLDKSGNEIWEGDILQLENGSRNPYTVIWSKKHGGWFFDGTPMGSPAFLIEYFKDCEVLGNIYENPELLNHSTQKG